MPTIRLLAVAAFLVALAPRVGRADGPGLPAPATTAGASTATPGAPATRAPNRRRQRARTPSAVVSFPGFRMNADGTSRCFVHVSTNVQATTRSAGRRFEVLLPGVRVRFRNDMHPLETRFFETPMLRARLERRGARDVAFVLELRADVTPTMHVEPSSAGGIDIVVELPAGHFTPGPPPDGGSVRPSDESTSGSSMAPGPSGTRPAEADRPEFSF